MVFDAVRRSPPLLISLLFVGMCVLLSGTLPGTLAAASPDTDKSGKYIETLYLRITAVGFALLEFEDSLIFRLEKKRPVDFSRAAARFISARKQIHSLRSLAQLLMKKLDSADPRRARIESLKGRFRNVAVAHRSNMEKILALGGGDQLREAVQRLAETMTDSPIASGTPAYPLKSHDDLF